MVRVCLLVSLWPVCSLHSIANAPRYEIPVSARLWRASLDTAIAQIGVQEATGRNDGARVAAYLQSVGLPQGNPYCYAGLYWSMVRAARAVQEPVILLKSGLASAGFNHAKRIGVRSQIQSPQRADFIFWKFARTPSGHVARIVSVGRAGWIETIEFNTSPATGGNQRDGGGVYKRKRNTRYPLGRMSLYGYIGATS